MSGYEYNEGLDSHLIPVSDSDVNNFVTSTYGKAYEQWLADRFDITVAALIKSDDQAEVNRHQGMLREIQTMQEFPELILRENKLMREDKLLEEKEKEE